MTALKRKLREISPSSLTVTVPSQLCQAMRLTPGMDISFRIDGNRIVMEPADQTETEIAKFCRGGPDV